MTKKGKKMEPNIYEKLKLVLAETDERKKILDDTLEKALRSRQDKKSQQDIPKLMKMQTDVSRLQMQLLEKLSKLAPTDTPAMHTPTPKEWALVRAAILRGEGPAWE